jgi:hypothetical protein
MSVLRVTVTRSDCAHCLGKMHLDTASVCSGWENPTEPSDEFDMTHAKELFDHRVWS